MKYRVLMWLMVGLIANGTFSRTLHAQSVTSLDSDIFAPGTDVSNAFAGVTLEAMSLVPNPNAPPSPFTTWMPSYSPVYAGAGNVFSSDSMGSQGWGAFLGPLDGSCFQSCAGPQGNNFGTNLLLNFSAPVDQVFVSQIGNAFNGVALEAFDGSNQEIGYCAAAPGNNQGPGNYGCYAVLSDHGGGTQWQVTTSLYAPDISKIVIGGYNMGGDQVNTIRYMAAPEIDPASLASGLTLLFGGLVVLRGRQKTTLI